MTGVADVNADKLIVAAAQDLQEKVKFPRPDWAVNIKTGAHRERQPDSPNWWWVRAASILRKIYLDGPLGTQRLRVAYGDRIFGRSGLLSYLL